MEVIKKISNSSIHYDVNINYKKKLSKNDQIFKNFIIKKLLSHKKRELKFSVSSLEKIIKLQHAETFDVFLKKFCEKNIEVYLTNEKSSINLYLTIISSYLLDNSTLNVIISDEFFSIFCNKNYKYNFLNLNALLSFSNKATQNLFIFLYKNIQNTSIEITIEDLKNILLIEEGYSRFYDLEKNVLLPALKDINMFFNNKITYKKIRESLFINSKISKIEFNFNTTYNEEISELFPLIENIPNMECLKNILLKSSVNYDFNYLKRNLQYTLLHQNYYDNLDEALNKNISYNYSETFFKNELVKLQKTASLIYKDSNFYENIENFREEIFKKIKLYNIENILFIFNIVKISLNIFSQIYKNNEILKNPIYNSFFYNLDKDNFCFFENEKYIILAEFNSSYCESHFAILKK